MDARLRYADGGPVVRRHHHHHRRSEILRATTAGGADIRAEMRRRYDDGNTTSDMFEDRNGEEITLIVRERELLGEVRQNADTIRARVDHEVDAAALAFKIEASLFIKDGGGHGEDAAVGAGRAIVHGTPSV